MTEATYRKKSLPHLLQDFNGRCAYCLDPKEFRAKSQSQVDHFDSNLKGRKRHYYKNLMLACAACNLNKHDKPVVNPYNGKQRLLNCTEENEFTGHICELENGKWEAKSDEGLYHLVSVGLTADCHTAKRHARRQITERILTLLTTAVQYKADNPKAVHNEMMGMVRSLLMVLDSFPPLVTKDGVLTAREWLKLKGIVI